MQANELLREIPKGLLRWYDFKSGGSALYIGYPGDCFAEALEEQGLSLTCALPSELDKLPKELRFDHIVSVRILELEPRPEAALALCRSLLSPDGSMLLGMNNRLGIRYFCGDRDPYTERNFDGVEGYSRAYAKKEDIFNGRCYSQAELRRMLKSAGWDSFRFYSVLSDLDNPSLILAEGYQTNEDLANRIVFPVYNHPDTVFLEEEGLYSTLVENGMFHTMANAYLIECSPSGRFSDACQITCSMERGREHARLTIIHKNGAVEKRPAYPEGLQSLQNLIVHERQLAGRGIPVLGGEIKNGSYFSPYVKSELGQLYLKRLLLTDKERFLRELDRFVGLILRSSEHLIPDAGDGEGALLRRGYPEMVPLNSFFIDGEFVFFDQEFSFEEYPANAVIARVLESFYAGNTELYKALPKNELYERYGLAEQAQRWKRMEWEFLGPLLNTKPLREYHASCRRSNAVLHSNRQRLNYSAEQYDRLFVDIFRNADTRKLILFGSGDFAKRFLRIHSFDYSVHAIVDNNAQRWGEQLEGVQIYSPDMLRELQPGEYKVLICIKNYLSVMKQLDGMGVAEYSIFDPNKNYPRKRKPILAEAPSPTGSAAPRKKFHIGYVPGVFDLFHVGHLNMFKRAKEQCDYLIVGVVTDEGVRKNKKVEPVVPFEERVEMIRACRYVDEVVEIPFYYSSVRDAYRMHHFDCQFTGSDYADDPNWLADKAFLEQHGAELIFFPYTESTSSTKLKELISKKLL